MNKQDSKEIKYMFRGKAKKVFDLLEEIENDKNNCRSNIIWEEGERNGRIPPVMFDYIRALVYDKMMEEENEQ